MSEKPELKWSTLSLNKRKILMQVYIGYGNFHSLDIEWLHLNNLAIVVNGKFELTETGKRLLAESQANDEQ